MHTNTLIALVLGIAVIGGGAYFVFNQPSSGSEDTQMESAEAGAFEGSMTALMKRGGNWKCTVDASANTGAGAAVSSGVVYVSGEKVRADFTSTIQGFGTVDSHMLADGTNVYTWSSMMPQGFKLPQAKMEGQGGAETSGSGFDANQSYSYDCQPGSADAALFSTPGNVTFTELSF